MSGVGFKWNGKTVRGNQLGKLMANSIEKTMLSQVKDHVTKKIASIVDPETGERPKVTIVGSNIKNLRFEIEGSAEVIAKVKRALD